MYKLPISLAIEIVCFAYALINLRTEKSFFWKSLVWFMGITVFFEGFGWTQAVIFHQRNHIIYNVEQPVEVFFISWVLWKLSSPSLESNLVFGTVLILYFSIFLIEGALINFTDYIDLSNWIAAFFFVLASCHYFYRLLKQETYIQLYKEPNFWLVVGIFMFYFCSTAINLFFDELVKINMSIGINVRFIIISLLNAILYGSWIKAFKCRFRQTILSF